MVYLSKNFFRIALLALCFMFVIYGSISANHTKHLDHEIALEKNDFDLEKVKLELRELMNEYSSTLNKQHHEQIIFSLESKLKSLISQHPKHEDEILKVARAMIKKDNHNWIIFRNETQLKIQVIPDKPATSKND